MKTRTKVITSIIALILSAVLAFTVIAVSNNKGKTSVAETRTVVLEESSIDAQSILDEFDDATLTTEGTTTYFEGFKPLDLNAVSELDYISEVDYETLSECTVKYNFSYDYETNVVTLAAAATLPDGSIEIDEISGVGFINDNGEIDAVMNIDGEGILLSEMSDAGMIENCGWLSSLIKKVATAVAVVAVAVATVAVVVATAGTAAPAVVAAGVAVASTVSTTAAAIASTSITVAAVAAGVAVVATIEEATDGIKVEVKQEENNKETDTVKIPEYPGDDPAKAPGDEWEWRGKGTPESGKGSWYNPETGETLHPDLEHGEPVGPHWDYTAPNGDQYKILPDGSWTLK